MTLVGMATPNIRRYYTTMCLERKKQATNNDPMYRNPNHGEAL